MPAKFARLQKLKRRILTRDRFSRSIRCFFKCKEERRNEYE